jgi:DNA-binding NarL/FixJ family response regulator
MVMAGASGCLHTAWRKRPSRTYSSRSKVVRTRIRDDEVRGSPRILFAALRAGASGFMLKDTPPAELLAGIRVVADGESLLSPRVTRHLIEAYVNHPQVARDDSPVLTTLTDRETEVLGLVGRGMSDTEIGEQLYVSPATVKTHISRLLMKLDARDRAQLVVAAYESGLVTPQRP